MYTYNLLILDTVAAVNTFQNLTQSSNLQILRKKQTKKQSISDSEAVKNGINMNIQRNKTGAALKLSSESGQRLVPTTLRWRITDACVQIYP